MGIHHLKTKTLHWDFWLGMCYQAMIWSESHFTLVYPHNTYMPRSLALGMNPMALKFLLLYFWFLLNTLTSFPKFSNDILQIVLRFDNAPLSNWPRQAPMIAFKPALSGSKTVLRKKQGIRRHEQWFRSQGTVGGDGAKTITIKKKKRQK